MLISNSIIDPDEGQRLLPITSEHESDKRIVPTVPQIPTRYFNIDVLTDSDIQNYFQEHFLPSEIKSKTTSHTPTKKHFLKKIPFREKYLRLGKIKMPTYK